jgi:RNA polymerase-binding transcription factor DksA
MENINKYKKLLEQEKAKLLKELSTIGQKNPSNEKDWEATPTNLDSDTADENETADMIEEFEGNSAILKQLEIQLLEVESALGKIESNTYGKCNVCGAEIPENRLEANPASLTCIEHTN